MQRYTQQVLVPLVTHIPPVQLEILYLIAMHGDRGSIAFAKLKDICGKQLFEYLRVTFDASRFVYLTDATMPEVDEYGEWA